MNYVEVKRLCDNIKNGNHDIGDPTTFAELMYAYIREVYESEVRALPLTDCIALILFRGDESRLPIWAAPPENPESPIPEDFRVEGALKSRPESDSDHHAKS